MNGSTAERVKPNLFPEFGRQAKKWRSSGVAVLNCSALLRKTRFECFMPLFLNSLLGRAVFSRGSLALHFGEVCVVTVNI